MKIALNRGSLYVLLAAFLWGTAGIFVRTLSDSISEMQVVLGRAVFTALILAAAILIKDRSLFKIKLKDLWIFLLDGIGSIVLFNYSYYTTMSLASLSVAAVLLYTAPFFVVIISLLLFGKKLNLQKCAALFVAFFGCCMVSGIFDSQHRISPKALLFGLLTGFGYALYTIFGDILIRRGYKTLTITFYVFLFAAVGSVPFVNLGEVVSAMTPKSLLWVFMMAVFNTVLPYIFYTNGLKLIDSTAAPIIATLEPVVATVVGAGIFKEELTVYGIIGIALVLASVVVLNLKRGKVKAKANAKINLSLYISGKREDGYHLIDTIMQSVSLADTITVKKAKAITVACSDDSLSGEENIAYKAAELFFKETRISGGAGIYIKKRIPSAAGLGSGSADAAAVLLALDRIYGTNLNLEELCRIGLSLGADVPFFIKGGTQRARGIGEELSDITPFTKGYFVLCKGESKPSTKEMYRLLDSKDYKYIDIESAVNFCASDDLEGLCSVADNSFISVWNESTIPSKLETFNPLKVGLSGSGPTWFAVFENKHKAKCCERALKSEGLTAFTVKPCKKAVIFGD